MNDAKVMTSIDTYGPCFHSLVLPERQEIRKLLNFVVSVLLGEVWDSVGTQGKACNPDMVDLGRLPGIGNLCT